MLEYLFEQGYEIQILFIGGLTTEDSEQIKNSTSLEVTPTRPPIVFTPFKKDKPSVWVRKYSKVILREALQLLRRFPAELAWLLWRRQWAMSLRLDLALHEPKLSDFVRPGDIRQLHDVLRNWQPDVFLVEYVKLSSLVQSIPQATRTQLRVLLDAHDVVSDRRLRFHAKNVPHDIDITPAEETARLALYDAIMAIQSNDAQMFRQLQPYQKIMVVGHAQHIKQTPLSERIPSDRVRFMFLGSDMTPNQEAAERLVYSIWPQINAQLGSLVSLSIGGKVGQMFTGRVIPEGVRISGHIADLDLFYASHDIFLNPVAFGGGLKIKNVEALAHGLALITSPVGAEGLENNTAAFIVGENDQKLIGFAIELARDQALRNSMSNAALDYAKQHFSGKAVYLELDQFLSIQSGPTA